MAKKFNFRLQPLLRLREFEEDKKKKAFAEANRALAEEVERREQLANERKQMIENVREAYSTGAPFEQVLDHYKSMNQVEYTLRKGMPLLKQLEHEVERTRAELMEAKREKKVIEIVKEKRKNEYMQQLDKEEQQQIDEISMNLAKKRKGEDGN